MKNNNTEPTNTMMATVDVVVVEVLEKVVNAAVAVSRGAYSLLMLLYYYWG